jgi:hypothetical protein
MEVVGAIAPDPKWVAARAGFIRATVIRSVSVLAPHHRATRADVVPAVLGVCGAWSEVERSTGHYRQLAKLTGLAGSSTKRRRKKAHQVCLRSGGSRVSCFATSGKRERETGVSATGGRPTQKRSRSLSTPARGLRRGGSRFLRLVGDPFPRQADDDFEVAGVTKSETAAGLL